MRRTNVTWLAVAGLVTACGAYVLAGPLSPPPGPISSTGKTTQEIYDKAALAASAEPRVAINATNTPGDADSVYRISQSGSYYLTGNFSAPSGKGGIKIDSFTGAYNVSIDLNGYTIKGTVGSLAGVWTNSITGGTSVRISNGTILSMGGNGIDIYGTVSSVSDVDVEFCNEGIKIQGGPATIVNCRASRNNSAGFDFVSHTAATGCVSYFNTGAGFLCGSSIELNGCLATSNTGVGVSLGSIGMMTNCNVSGGAPDVVSMTQYCRVSHCRINGSIGIHATGLNNFIEDNDITASSAGVKVDDIHNFVVRNSITGTLTPLNIVAGNTVGPLANAATISTAGPWANFQN